MAGTNRRPVDIIGPGLRVLNFDENMYPDPVDFRLTRTDKIVRSFLGPSHASPVWEDNDRVVVRVHKSEHRYAFLRLSRDGRIERTSRILTYLHWPITMLEPASSVGY